MTEPKRRAVDVCMAALDQGLIPAERQMDALQCAQAADCEGLEATTLVDEGFLSEAQLGQLLAYVLEDAAGEPDEGAAEPAETTKKQPGVQAQAQPQRFPQPFGRDFVLECEIGRGGMGRVYKAWQKSLSRHVALKVLLPSRALGREFTNRFVVEARAAARLQHPNIVSVYHIGSHGEQYYFTMDLVDGAPLSRLMRKEALPLEEILSLVEKVARGVHHAHENGVLHRDVKPANILVDSTGEPRVVDFGLAKDLETDLNLSRSGDVMGTPSYMSPEQAGGYGNRADRRTDVYSLGAVLYALLVGNPPFRGDNVPKLLRMIAEDEPVPPRTLNASVPPDVETICLTCLRKEPERRYETAEALADDIRRYLDGEPISARPSSVLYRAGKWLKRRKAVASVVAASLALIVGLVAAWVITLQRRTREAEDAARGEREAAQAERAAKHEAQTERQKAQEEEARAKEAAAESAANEAIAFANTGEYSAAVDACRRGRAIQDTPLLRIIEWNAERGRGHPALRITPPGEWRIYPPVHPMCRGALLVMRLMGDGEAHGIGVWDVRTGRLIKVISPVSRGPHKCMAFSSDGRLLTESDHDRLREVQDVSKFGRIRIWSVHTWKEREPIQTGAWVANRMNFSPNGRFIATSGRRCVRKERGEVRIPPDGRIRVWDVHSGKEALSIDEADGSAGSPVFSPDGRFIAGNLHQSSGSTQIRLWDVATGRDVRTFSADGAKTSFTRDFAFSPDGKRLAAACRQDTGSPFGVTSIIVFEVETGRRLMELEGAGGPLLFSPEGRFLAARVASTTWDLGGRNSMIKLYDPRTGDETVTLGGLKSTYRGLAFALGGRRLVAVDGLSDVKLWRLDCGRQTTLHSVLQPELRRVTIASVALSPDERVMALSVGGPTESPKRIQRTTILWDLEHDREVRRLGTYQSDLMVHQCVAFSPSGRLLADVQHFDIRIWDTSTWQVTKTLKGHKERIWSLVFTPNGKRLLSSSRDRTIRLWSLATGQQEAVLKGHEDEVISLAMSQDGSLIASGSWRKTIKVWDVAKQQTILTIPPLSAQSPVIWLRPVALSPDGKVLAAGYTNGVLRLWDVPSGRERTGEGTRLRMRGQDVGSVAFRADGRLLAARAVRTIELWDVASSSKVMTLFGPAPGNVLAFSRDGKRLFAGWSKGFSIVDVDPAHNPELPPIDEDTGADSPP